jgi:hypothetical protein
MGVAEHKVKMWFEGQLFYGPAGATGTTQLTHVMEASWGVAPKYAETTERGDGTKVPAETQSPTAVSITLKFKMPNRTDDPALQALLAAVASVEPLAIRGKDYAAGKGPDLDGYLAYEHGQPVNGVQTYDFTVTATSDAARLPNYYV